jgi:TonB family protein
MASSASLSFGQRLSGAEFRKLSIDMKESYAKGDYDKALVIADRLVEIAEQELGKNDLGTGQALKNRGLIEAAKGDEKQAEKSFDAAVDIFKKHKDTLSKTEGADLASLLENLGRIRAKSDVFWTESIFKEALDWRERSNGPDAVETVTPLVQLANIQFWRRDFKKSAAFYTRALTNLGKSTTASNDDVTFVYYRTQCSYRKAKIEDEFELLKNAYGRVAEFGNIVPHRAKYINAGVINGKALFLERPRWPAEARNANSDGPVEVEVLVDERGEIISACAKNGGPHPALIEAAEVAAYKSRFSPTTLEGNPVKVSGRIIYIFKRR